METKKTAKKRDNFTSSTVQVYPHLFSLSVSKKQETIPTLKMPLRIFFPKR